MKLKQLIETIGTNAASHPGWDDETIGNGLAENAIRQVQQVLISQGHSEEAAWQVACKKLRRYWRRKGYIPASTAI